jgi:hypothetical protein
VARVASSALCHKSEYLLGKLKFTSLRLLSEPKFTELINFQNNSIHAKNSGQSFTFTSNKETSQ